MMNDLESKGREKEGRLSVEEKTSYAVGFYERK